MNKRTAIAFILITTVMACTKDQMQQLEELDQEMETLIKQVAENGQLDYFELPEADDLASIPQDEVFNPLTTAKVDLGKFLFFDTGFAMNALKADGMGTFSCASCHIPSAGFRPGSFQGVADGGEGYGINGEDRRRHQQYVESEMDVQSARPLSLLNVAYVENTFWNGQFGSTGENVGTESLWSAEEGTDNNSLGMKAIETQNIKGLETHRILITEALIDEYGYRDMFDAAFPNLSDEEKYSNFGGSLALSAYIRTLISHEASFQKWLKGDSDAMSYEEKQGAILFFGKANCKACHKEQNLGSNEFHALGVKDMDQRPSYNTAPDDKRNLGRGGFTQNESDNFKFRVPQLYNMSDTPFFFHGASANSLADVIEYKCDAITENERVDQDRLSEKFLQINLTDEEKSHLVAFIEKSLRDPELERYAPTEVPSGFCFPNNDTQSKLDLGCN